ncbi:MAG: MEMO1 family protein [Candidatus Njordarchaeales archaeon]
MSEYLREPAVAGYFYEGRKDKLMEQIKWAFLHPLGPGRLPEQSPGTSRNLIAAQVPHAGYIYSGPAAAHVYYALHQDGKPETFIILGPNHTGFGSAVSVYPKGIWRTPLGDVKIDEEFSRELLKYEPFEEDLLAHASEHSIEVQIPFIQFTFGNDVKIVPITLLDQRLETANKIAEGILKAKEALDKDIIVLASSDMSHYEPHEEARLKDLQAIEYIENLDVEGLYRYILSENVTMCGYGPVMVAMIIAKYLNATGLLLQYYTSGDITGDKHAVVGYASIIFGRGLIKPKRRTLEIKEPLPV